MNWIILLLISFITTIIVFVTCGAGGGLMMLVSLNGFSESNAMPILIFFVLVAIGISLANLTSDEKIQTTFTLIRKGSNS